MQEIHLKMGQLIELELAKSKYEIIQFRTLVEDAVGDDEFTLLAPMYRGAPYPFHNEEILDFIFTVHDADNRAQAYTFRVKPVERYHRENITYLKVQRISDIVKLQRRGFYRLNYVVEMNYEILRDEGDIDTHDLKTLLTRDVSAGGFCGIVSQPMSEGTLIRIHLVLGKEPILLKAKVIHAQRFEDSRIRSEIRCEYVGLTSKETAHLIQEINTMQSEYIRHMAGASLEERLMAYGHEGFLFSERRTKKDWVLVWLDWSVIVTWAISVIIIGNTLLAMPQRPNTLARFYGYSSGPHWDMERIKYNMYYLLILFIVTSTSVIMNSTRMKREGDRYRLSLVIMGVLSIVLIAAYLFWF